jgi:hypothetical protein
MPPNKVPAAMPDAPSPSFLMNVRRLSYVAWSVASCSRPCDSRADGGYVAWYHGCEAQLDRMRLVSIRSCPRSNDNARRSKQTDRRV